MSTAISCHNFSRSDCRSADIYIYRSGLFFWIKCAEVAVLLQIANAKAFFKLIDSHYLAEYDEIRPCPDISPLPLNIHPQTLFIKQSGLYVLLSKCRKMPIALIFRTWIDNVLHDLYNDGDDDDDNNNYILSSPNVQRRSRPSLIKSLQQKLVWSKYSRIK